MGKIKEHYHDELEAKRALEDGMLGEVLSQSDNYEGYAEFQFLAAFDALCIQNGGVKKGRELALKIITEKVFQ